MSCSVFDGILTDFPREAGEQSDEARIMRAVRRWDQKRRKPVRQRTLPVRG